MIRIIDLHGVYTDNTKNIICEQPKEVSVKTVDNAYIFHHTESLETQILQQELALS